MERATRDTRETGLTLVELLVAVAIFVLLSVFAINSFHALNARDALDSDANRVVAELNEARSLTLSSQYADQYGVHFASSSVTLFEGASYVAGSPSSTVSLLNSLVAVSSIALSGGGSDVVFERLTGESSATGTVTLVAEGGGALSKTITIYQTGVSEMQ